MSVLRSHGLSRESITGGSRGPKSQAFISGEGSWLGPGEKSNQVQGEADLLRGRRYRTYSNMKWTTPWAE